MTSLLARLSRLELPVIATALGAGAAVASFAGGPKLATGAAVAAVGLLYAAYRLPCGCATDAPSGGGVAAVSAGAWSGTGGLDE